MLRNYTLEIITLIAIVVFILLFLIVSMGGNHEFAGSDDVGSQRIAEITGVPVDSFSPLIPQYVPPSGEIETTLFVLQAAIGGIILGFVFGYWIGQKKQKPGP